MAIRKWLLGLSVAFLCLALVATSRNVPEPPCRTFDGIASWYGPGFVGHSTASGEIFTSQELTAAHRSLPLGIKVRVINLNNGRSAVVRINDRGPYIGERIIDLSRAAAQQLGFDGLSKVAISTCWDERFARR